MITKEQYSLLKEWYGYYQSETLDSLKAEYEAAHPPTPQVVCPACGHAMELIKNQGEAWHCVNACCATIGPIHDIDAKKVMALCRRKLPIKPPFVALEGMAYPIIDYRIPKAGELVAVPGMRARPCPIETAAKEIKTAILGDPIDIAEWFDE